VWCAGLDPPDVTGRLSWIYARELRDMARGRKQATLPPGCALPLLFIVMPFAWLGDKCWQSDLAKMKADQEATAQAEIAAAVQRDRESTRLRVQQEAVEKAKKDAERAAAVASVAALHPWQRLGLLRKCVSKIECPGGTYDSSTILDAAKTPAERKQLQAVESALVKARDRANASLRCCDGSDSPTCTCGNPRRGCCSHHSGVCGCSADMR